MAYGVNDEVRRLIGELTTTDFAEADITTFVAEADALINTVTGKTWTSSETEYKAIQIASNYYAAAMILDTLEDPEKKAESFKKEFWNIIRNIKSNSTTAISNDVGYMVKTAGSEE